MNGSGPSGPTSQSQSHPQSLYGQQQYLQNMLSVDTPHQPEYSNHMFDSLLIGNSNPQGETIDLTDSPFTDEEVLLANKHMDFSNDGLFGNLTQENVFENRRPSEFSESGSQGGSLAGLQQHQQQQQQQQQRQPQPQLQSQLQPLPQLQSQSQSQSRSQPPPPPPPTALPQYFNNSSNLPQTSSSGTPLTLASNSVRESGNNQASAHTPTNPYPQSTNAFTSSAGVNDFYRTSPLSWQQELNQARIPTNGNQFQAQYINSQATNQSEHAQLNAQIRSQILSQIDKSQAEDNLRAQLRAEAQAQARLQRQAEIKRGVKSQPAVAAPVAAPVAAAAPSQQQQPQQPPLYPQFLPYLPQNVNQQFQLPQGIPQNFIPQFLPTQMQNGLYMMTPEQMQQQAQYYQNLLRAQQQSIQLNSNEGQTFNNIPIQFENHTSSENLSPIDSQRLKRQQEIYQEQQQRLIARKQQELQAEKSKSQAGSKRASSEELGNDKKKSKSTSPLNVADVYRGQQIVFPQQFPPQLHALELKLPDVTTVAGATEEFNTRMKILDAHEPPHTTEVKVAVLFKFASELVDQNEVAEKYRNYMLNEFESKQWEEQQLREMENCTLYALDKGTRAFWEALSKEMRFVVRISNWLRQLVRAAAEDSKLYRNLATPLKVLVKLRLSAETLELVKIDKALSRPMVHGNNDIKELCKTVLEPLNKARVKVASSSSSSSGSSGSSGISGISGSSGSSGSSTSIPSARSVTAGTTAPPAQPARSITTAPPARPAVIKKKVVGKTNDISSKSASTSKSINDSSKSNNVTSTPTPTSTSSTTPSSSTSQTSSTKSNSIAKLTSNGKTPLTTTTANVPSKISKTTPITKSTTSSGFFNTIKSAKTSKPPTGPISLKEAASKAEQPAKKPTPITAPMTMLFSGSTSIKSQIEKNKELEAAKKTIEKSSVKKKSNKTVHWKSDEELVQIKEIPALEDEDGEPHEMKHASDRRAMDFQEAIQIRNIAEFEEEVDWYEALEFDWGTDIKKPFRKAGSIKRGGLRQPQGEEMKIQQARESHALIAIYSSVDEIPDNPTPPDAADHANDIKSSKLIIINLPVELETNPAVLKFNQELLIRQQFEEAINKAKAAKANSSTTSPPPPPPPPSSAPQVLSGTLPPQPPPSEVELSSIIKFLKTIPNSGRNQQPFIGQGFNIPNVSTGTLAPPPPPTLGDEFRLLRAQDIRQSVRDYTGIEFYRSTCKFYGTSAGCKYDNRCKNVHIERGLN